MTNWQIDENESVYEYLEKPEVKTDDTIEVISDNQEGYKKYKVISGENGKKDLKTIADWSMDIYEGEGGGKKRRRSKSKHTRRRKNRKSRRNKNKRSRRR